MYKDKRLIPIKFKEWYLKKKMDKSWVEKERLRKRLLYRRLVEENPEKYRRNWRKISKTRKVFITTDKIRINARLAIKKAVDKGLIEKPKKCSSCRDGKLRIEAHHPDYSKPLKVMWLCSRCHGLEHRIK